MASVKPSSVTPNFRGVNPKPESIIDWHQSQWAMWFFLPLVIVSHIPPLFSLTRPHGYFSALLDATYGPRDTRFILLLITGAAFNTFILTAAGSNMGQTLGHPHGYRLKTPRLIKVNLTGLPHRMVAAHENILENFPGFAAALCLVSVFRPTSQPLIDGLALHFIFKQILYYPVYVLDWNIRIIVHLASLASLLMVLGELYTTL